LQPHTISDVIYLHILYITLRTSTLARNQLIQFLIASECDATRSMLTAFKAQPVIELKPRDKSKIESILAYGKSNIDE